MANSPTQGATNSDVIQDGQTELKRRARRRLIGASALALLAVVVLPMIMDKEPRPPALDIQVRIPSQDSSGMSGAIADRALGRKSPTPLPPLAESKAPVGPDPSAGNEGTAKTDAKTDSRPVQSAMSDPKAAAKPAEKPSAKNDVAEQARAAAALSGSTTKGDEQWVVTLGAYRNTANVRILTAKLKEMGVPHFTEKLDSPQGARTRVRAGPFASREAAEKAQAKAKSIGVSGSVTRK